MARFPSDGWDPASRRAFLRALGWTGIGSMLAGSGLFGASAHARPEQPLPAFEEIPASVSGISWAHVNGRSPMAHLPETVGTGCAFLDYDNDGWMDIYFVNSGRCDFYEPPQSLRNALYHNNRDGTFTDVTQKAGVPGDAYGMGVAVGDYDGDSFPDLYVTQYPHSILYHNNGDGTFTDVTAKAGVAAPGWATSAVWFDYDNDGRLDLFVCHFVDYSKAKLKFCGDRLSGERFYCIPSIYDPMPCWLFRNNGDGTTMAGRLEGHLLLEHGDIDDNVHPVETIRFVDALMKANKNFDMLFVPNMFHGESGEHALYLVRRRWDYFVQNLLGVTPPPNFEIKEDRESLGNGRRRRR